MAEHREPVQVSVILVILSHGFPNAKVRWSDTGTRLGGLNGLLLSMLSTLCLQEEFSSSLRMCFIRILYTYEHSANRDHLRFSRREMAQHGPCRRDAPAKPRNRT